MTTKGEAAKIISEKLLHKSWRVLKTFDLEVKKFAGGHREIIDWQVYFIQNSAGVLLYKADTDQILLADQFRVGAFLAGEEKPFMHEFCIGQIDKNYTPEETVKKEALEEAGCTIIDLEYITKIYPSSAYTAETTTLYCGLINEAKEGIYGTDIEEEIQTKLYDAADVIKMLDNNEILDAKTALCLHWFARNHERLKAKWG